jgi:hypothetical protein
MPDEWEQHCPIEKKGDSLARRQAWRGGWQYREEHGPGNPTLETSSEVMDSPSLLVAWLRGYAAADRQKRPN